MLIVGFIFMDFLSRLWNVALNDLVHVWLETDIPVHPMLLYRNRECTWYTNAARQAIQLFLHDEFVCLGQQCCSTISELPYCRSLSNACTVLFKQLKVKRITQGSKSNNLQVVWLNQRHQPVCVCPKNINPDPDLAQPGLRVMVKGFKNQTINQTTYESIGCMCIIKVCSHLVYL